MTFRSSRRSTYSLGHVCAKACVLIAALSATVCQTVSAHDLSAERVVFQTKLGDLEFALYPKVRNKQPWCLSGG